MGEIRITALAKSPDGNRKVNTPHLHHQHPQERVLIQEVRLHFMTCLIIYFYKLHLLGMPTTEEVCSTFGLNDVDLEYTDQDMQNLTSYKLFQQHVRPHLTKENPKVIVVLLCAVVILIE